jgi:di/tricarboxylate transporter
MMPIVASMARTFGVSASRFLMPLAFMSGIGGMTTLVGNPANMVVNELYIKAGYPSLSLVSFLPVGLVTLSFGLLVLAPAALFYLARRKDERGDADKGATLRDLAEKYHLGQNMYKMAVPRSSSMPGHSLGEIGLTGKYGVVIQEVRRPRGSHGPFSLAGAIQIAPDRNTVILAGDVFYCMGGLEHVQAMAADYGLELVGSPAADNAGDKYSFEYIGISELVLMSASRVVGRTVAESSLRENFGITLLGIQRGDQYILDDLKDQALQAGDALLVQGPWENLTRLARHSDNWVVVSRPQDHASGRRLSAKIPFVGAVLALTVAAMASGILPIVIAVLLACLAIGLGGVYRDVNEAYSTINLETLVMISCVLPLAIAIEKAGILATASELITTLGVSHGPWAALAVVYALSSCLNIVLSTTPVVLLMTSPAIQAAVYLDVSPLPFVFAVATAACLCFASPISQAANILVMSAGRYTFMDYMKIGLPLQSLLGLIMLLALPLLFPF